MASSVKQILTHDQLWDVLSDQPVDIPTPAVVQRFRNYTSPDVSRPQIHPGRAFDSTHRDETHGVRTNLNDANSGALINPKLRTTFENRLFNLDELVYERNRTIMKQEKALPSNLSKYGTTFGIVTQSCENAGELINPAKSRAQIEYEFEKPRSMYLFSHKEFEPGEQLERNYKNGEEIRHKTHGVPTPVFADGRHAREALVWSRSNHVAPVVSQRVNEFDERRSDNTEIRHRRFFGQTSLPIDFRFGLPSNSDRLSAGEIIHQRAVQPVKFDEKSQSAVAKLRAHLCSIHMTTFRSQLQAFQYYDLDQDGFISREELTSTIDKNFYLQVSDGLISALIHQCDLDRDGKFNFLEFSNFLCYRTGQPSGLEPLIEEEKKKTSFQGFFTGIIRDQQGRPLLNGSDLVEHSSGKFYPRKLVSQVDEMIPDGWKTSYDKINEAPFRPEPEIKRQYGVPSLEPKSNLVIPNPNTKNRPSKGSNTIVGALLSPSIWNDRGLTDEDLFEAKTMEEIRDIFGNAQIPVSGEDFVYAWTTAAAQHPKGQVSVASFKQVLDQKNRSLGNYQILYN